MNRLLATTCAAIRFSLSLLLILPASILAAPPDLTASGAIAALKTNPNASPVYGKSYNLGPTGLRGWIYIDRNNVGDYGLQTDQSRQILVTIVGAGTPAAGVLAVDDVILGVKAGTGPVPPFTGDCRKAFGWALVDAESPANGGVLSLLRWRAGTTSTVSITLPVMGAYASTAPFNCPKSSLVLANARNNLVGQLLANPSYLTKNLAGAVHGLALLAGVAPGDPNYATVQSRLQTFARSLVPSVPLTGCDTWNWGYINIFLSEYYLRTVADGSPDTLVLPGIHAYTVGLARGQSKYGTFGHRGAEQLADGSLHGSIPWYGPVNSAGIPANIGIVIGKKALQTGGQAIDPEIDPAIQRANQFFGWFVNKGSIPYGEHIPGADNHASNGKDEMCAVLFGLQNGKSTETEYFSRMSTAGCTGREYGHTGQGFSYLWGALGANVGGAAAVTAYFNNIRWHLDLERRSDGSFVYDGGEQYGAGTTSGGTYLGSSELYGGMNPTAWYILAYSLPLQRINLTGRDANPANTLNATKVAHAISAATYKLDCTDTVAFPVSRLITDLGDYDPVVRSRAAVELSKRSLTTADENTLITMAEGPDANARMGACEALGLRKTTAALPALGRRLSDSDYWVRGKAAGALKNFGTAAAPQLTTMLTAFINNATDPYVIDWTDPIQFSNGFLSDALFRTLADNTAAADKETLLYPALRAGLRQPGGHARGSLGNFINTRLTLDDVNAVAPSIVQAAAERSPADRMFSDEIRYAALNTLGKFKVEEAIPLSLMVKEQTWHGDDWDPFTLLQNTYRGAARDALPTLYKWRAHLPQFAADGSITAVPGRYENIESKIHSTIAAIENDPNPPTLNYFKSITASATPDTIAIPSAVSLVSANVTDLDNGTPNYLWTKVSGAGNVSFSPNGMAEEPNRAAIFDTPGTYVLRVTAVDRSILDYRKWITFNLGYRDFQTYDEILGGVSKEVTIVVNPDPNRAPVAQNQSIITPQNTAATITLLAVDPDNDPVTYNVVAQPAHGTLSGNAPGLTYTPNPGYTGADSFTFRANDGKVDSSIATVTIDMQSGGNRRPTAINQADTTHENTPKGITLAGNDPDGDPLVYQITSGPLRGTLTGTPPNLTYRPAPGYPADNFNGTDSFTFTVSDGSLTSATATVSITVIAVNNPPQANAQSVNIASNTANSITLTGTDPEGYALAYAVTGNPSYGTLTGIAPDLTYTPLANFHGSDSFTFRVTDSEGAVSSNATVSITVVNDPPVADPQSMEIAPDTATSMTLTGSDNCNDPLTFAIVSQPSQGSLSGTPPTLTYTPAPGFTGADSFTFKTNDGVNDSAVATVSINVLAWNTLTNIASGAWSAGASWSGGVAPVAGGGSGALLVFNTASYSGTSSNDLAGTFQLNRWTIGSLQPALTVTGNAISFAANSGVLPRFNMNGANAVSISNNLGLAANTTFGGTGSGSVTLSGVISGSGGVLKTSVGSLTLSGLNTFTGGTIVSNGTFMLGHRNGCGTGAINLAAGTTFQQVNFEGNSSSGALPNAFVLSGTGNVVFNMPFGGAKDIWLSQPVSGTGGITVQGGARALTLTNNNTFSGGITLTNYNNRVQIQHASALGTGTFRTETTTANSGQLVCSANLSSGVGVANAFEIASGAYLNILADGTNHLRLSGPITSAAGNGNLYKAGTATLTLSGANTYTGTTTIAAGNLACTDAASLGNGPVVIISGAKLNLNFSGTRQVSALTLAGVAQANGTYGSTASPAAIKNDTYFSGTGTITVSAATTTSLALTGGTSPSNLGSPLTFTATVTGNAPTGNLSFYAGPTLLGSSALNGSYQASLTTSGLAAGFHNITAQYAGDGNNFTSTSSILAIEVRGGVTPPLAPTGLSGSTGSRIVNLTWNAVGSASNYLVKRSLVSGGPYSTVAYTSLTAFTDSPLVNETTYYYVISAANSAGEGPNSAQIAATPVNLAPVADSQSITTVQDAAKPVVLTASDPDGDPLTYAIVTPPANGSLSGTLPNLTYTPAAGYSGSDSFTFKVNDGETDSAPATVSVTVVPWATWTNIAPGNWSDGSRWSGGNPPAAGGAPNGLLVFNTSPYSGTSNNDLAGNFQLNRWNLGSSLPALTVSGNNLSFVLNNGVSPQLNQNSSSAITISNPVILTDSTTIGGTGSGAITLSGVVSGFGGLSKTTSGSLTLSGANTYSGGTTMSSGTFMLGNKNGCGTGIVTLAAGTTFQQIDFEGNTSSGALPNAFVLSGTGRVIFNMPFGGAKDVWLSQPVSGTGGITVQGGTRTLTLTNSNTFSGGVRLVNANNRVQIQHANALGTGVFRSENTTANSALLVCGANLSSGSGVANTFDIASGAFLNIFADGANHLRISGPITSAVGNGNLYKAGTATLTLSGTNTYTGTTTVAAGTLAASTSSSLGRGALSISTGAKVALNFAGSSRVASLSLGGAAQANGSYGSTSSAATFKNDTWFSGTGVLGVGPATTTTLALTGGSNPSAVGSPLTITATVAGSAPTGNVVFYAGSSVLGTAALNGSYQASLTTSSLETGPHEVTAVYLGNSGNAASTSAALTIQVVPTLMPPATPVNLTATPGSNVVTLSWDASFGATSYTVKRSTSDGGPYTILGSSASPSYNDTLATNGTTYYYVVSASNNIGESADSFQVSATPVTQPSSVSLVSSPAASGTYGGSVTFTATVSVSGASATGTVTFRSGGNIIGTGTLSGGVATLGINTLAVASHSITATYEGDDTYSGSVSPPLAFTVNPKPLSITGVTAANKVYDGTTTATLSGGTISGGLVGSDVVTVVPGSGTFASANAGTWAVTASGYSLGGSAAGNYILSAQPAVPNATITARPIQLSGTRTYDGTTTAQANILTISNNVDGSNLNLGGNASLAGKDAGPQAVVTDFSTPARVQSATGSTTTSSLAVNLPAAPATGNTLVAVISTRGTSANQITGITGGGVVWTRVSQAANSGGTTTEIWYGPDVSVGTAGITITQAAALRSAAVVVEYSGLLVPTSFDKEANNISSVNSTAASTGTTATTTQANELWLGGIGIADGRRTLNAPYGNAFAVVASAQSGAATADSMVYALEKIVSATGEAGTGGTVSASDAWSGAIATFKAASTGGLTLSGPAAANYTLTGLTGTVTITPKNLTATGLGASNKIYDGTVSASLTGTAALLSAQAPGSGSSGDGKPYTGDALALSGTPAGSFSTKHAGNNKPVIVTGLTLGGAQAGNYTLAQPAGLTANITPLPITVSAVNASKTYDSTTTAPGTPTITPALAGDDTTTALSQSFQTPEAGIGNKVLIPAVSINDGNGGANYAVTLQDYPTGTINPAPVSVTLGNLTHAYDGTPKSATVATDPADKLVSLTYDGSPTPPTDAGSYAVEAIVTEPNHTGTASDTLVITADLMSSWRSAHFSAVEIAAGLADDTANPDGDEYNNLTEYILGTDPRAFTPPPLGVTSAGGGQVTLSFVARAANGAGYTGKTRIYTIEGNSALANPASWQPVTGHTHLTGATQTSNITGDDQAVTVTLPAAPTACFYRLNVRIE